MKSSIYIRLLLPCPNPSVGDSGKMSSFKFRTWKSEEESFQIFKDLSYDNQRSNIESCRIKLWRIKNYCHLLWFSVTLIYFQKILYSHGHIINSLSLYWDITTNISLIYMKETLTKKSHLKELKKQCCRMDLLPSYCLNQGVVMQLVAWTTKVFGSTDNFQLIKIYIQSKLG